VSDKIIPRRLIGPKRELHVEELNDLCSQRDEIKKDGVRR
jgi:hypothetical protein